MEKVAYFYWIDKITLLVTTDGQQLPVDYSLDRLSVLLNPKYFTAQEALWP